jgi:hypothetical protein
MPSPTNVLLRLRLRYAGWQNRRRIARLARQVAIHSEQPSTFLRPYGRRPKGNLTPSTAHRQPVVLFNASTRLTGLSLNAAFQLLTGWALRLAGIPVVHFVCQSGLLPCVLGTNRQDYTTPPPCASCLAQSRRLHAGAEVHGFPFHADPDLSAALQNLSVEDLSTFEYPFQTVSGQHSAPSDLRLSVPPQAGRLRDLRLRSDPSANPAGSPLRSDNQSQTSQAQPERQSVEDLTLPQQSQTISHLPSLVLRLKS